MHVLLRDTSCDDKEQLTGGPLTCFDQSAFIITMDIHARSYECLQHRHISGSSSNLDIIVDNRYT